MARHVLRNALVLWLSGQHLNRPCKSGEATKATGKQKWPTLRNLGIRYSLSPGNMPTCGDMPPQLRAAYPSNTINGERKSARAGHVVLGKEKEKENDIK
jgi:hypothetical protein